MHTILGANGIVAQELSLSLFQLSLPVRQVSRNPRRVNATDDLVICDLLDAKATMDAVAGSEVVYLVAGLKYATAIWETQWPQVMGNVINACKQHEARLVFFDNVYAYGRVEGVMTEITPYNPISKKGEIRAKTATLLLDEIQKGNLFAMIARSADFYGPGATQSFLYSTVFQRLKMRKAPQWLGSAHRVHTFTFTRDIGRGLATLGNALEAFGHTWHLPTSPEHLTGSDLVKLACQLANQRDRLQVAPTWMLNLMEIFIPILRENKEMMYQFEHDYCFDSTKIDQAFHLKAMPYANGISECLTS